MRLRVTDKQHTHAGKTYRVGEEFEGTESTLQNCGDRLERVDPQIKASVPKKRGRPRKDAPEADVNADVSPSE